MAEGTENIVKEVRRVDGGTIISLTGDVDLHHAPALHAALVQVANERPGRYILDLQDVPYIDSSGLGTFVEVFRRVNAYKGKMVLFGLNERVRSVFEISKLDRLFNICATEEEANAY
ncbi:MAG TPA: STAS domain-containing protein [Phycisphaerae bacterium]|nr:STAS domain-containing protein [Phycisphaerae bacterium]HRW54841.1 STAS domain-containing protein [Phycisphaerae bacterium]